MKKAETTKTIQKARPHHGVGRRKCAVARVWIRRGSGKIRVNGLEYTKYFDTKFDADRAATPMQVYSASNNYDIQVNINGSGKSAQADAVKLGIARAFVDMDAELKPLFRKAGLMTVDDRNVERKKYGQRGARRKFQFVKR